MSYSLQECVEIAKKEYPDLYPYAYVEKDGKYIFNLLKKGAPVDRAIADFHMVNSKTGVITGSISTMLLFKDKEFREMWQNATVLKSDSNENVEHSDFFLEPGDGWAIRRKSSNELSHHGISGQRWGVRNGPPYPLDQKTHNQVVSDKNKNNEQGLIPELVIGGASIIWSIDSAINGPITRLIKRVKQNKKTQKSKELNDAVIGDIAEHKDYSKESMPKEIDGDHSINEDMAAVNPYYAGASVPGTTNNCALCSFTYDLRRRGYDVTAKPSIEGNYDDVLMNDLYEGAHVDVLRGRDWYEVYDKAAQKYPEGARGVVGAYGAFGGGHAMSWEIHNGKLEIIDAQRNVRSSPEELAECLFQSNGEFIRTDNLKVRPEGIAKVSSELKDGWQDTVKSKNKEKAIKEIENNRSFSSSSKSPKKMTKQEKIKALEKIWKREHNGTHMDAQAEEYMNNWVNANMWSMHGHEGIVLIHNNRGARFMCDDAASWGVRLSGSPSNVEHSGIKGQKWGVRRFQNEDGTLTEAGKERYYKDTSKDGKKEGKTGLNKDGEPVVSSKSHTWKAKDAESLSDEELNRRNSRLQREKQYKDLTTPQWKKDAKQIFTDSLKKILIFPIVGIIAAFARTKFKDKIDPFLEKVGSKATSTIKVGKDAISRLLDPKAPHQISMDEYMKNNKG